MTKDEESALSDYFDTQLTADLFSKTGFLIRNSWRYNVSNQLTGSLSLEYGRRRLSQESPLTDNWRIIGNHNHILSPQTRINASVNIATQSFNNRFATDLNQRIQQSLFSNAGYSTSFDNGIAPSTIRTYLNFWGPMYLVNIDGENYLYQDRGDFEMFIDEKGYWNKDEIPEKLGIGVLGLRFSDIINMYFYEEDQI